jgi:uncharacterized protein YndB with AHSA1/START domain
MSRVKIELEFIFKASPTIVYQFLTDPPCLVRWFCEEVDVSNEIYTFNWDGYDQDAEVIDDIEEERLRLKWLDADDEDEYLEYRIYKSDVTNETILEITDFCDDDDVKSTKDVWANQIDQLKVECGG